MRTTERLAPSHDQRRAFTLVELSIVLTIIGLITGGILAGQSMVRNAKMRSVTTDAAMYKNAIASFKEKFNFLPGDMPNAVTVWGAVAGASTNGMDGTCRAYLTVPPADGTCNGDGNGFIGASISDGYQYETYRAWQQLALAGMIKGKYYGHSASPSASWHNYNNLPDLNVPGTRLSKTGGWSIRGFPDDYAGAGDWFATSTGNYLMIGAVQTYPDIFGPQGGGEPVMKAEEAFQIDSKLDDGMPGTGNIMAFKASGVISPNCTVDATATTAYKVAGTSIACNLIFRIDSNPG